MLDGVHSYQRACAFPMRLFPHAGDERTWHLSDWSWDPASCSAAPNAAAATKRQRTAGADLSASSRLVRSEAEASAQPCCSNQAASAAGCCDSGGGGSRDGGAVPCSFHLPPPFSFMPGRAYTPSPFAAAAPSALAHAFDRPASVQLPFMGVGPPDAGGGWPQPPTGLTGFSGMMHEAAAMEAPYFPSYQQQPQQQLQQWPNAVGMSESSGAGDQLRFDGAFDGAGGSTAFDGAGGSTARQCTLAELAAAMASGAIALSDSAPADEAEKMTCQVSVRPCAQGALGMASLLSAPSVDGSWPYLTNAPLHFPPIQVAGCGKDLSFLKDYHQRYRVCEVHIKLPQVIEGGAEGTHTDRYTCCRGHVLGGAEGVSL